MDRGNLGRGSRFGGGRGGGRGRSEYRRGRGERCHMASDVVRHPEKSTESSKKPEENNIDKIRADLDAVKQNQEHVLRRLKKNSAIIFGWPHDLCPFNDIHCAAAKVRVMRQFFSKVLSIPDDVQPEIDIAGVFVKQHVIVNFVRETDKETVNPYLKNLRNFNRSRTPPTIWRDDLTQRQLQLKKMIRSRRANCRNDGQNGDELTTAVPVGQQNDRNNGENSDKPTAAVPA